MVYRNTRIVSFYIAIYQYTGNIAHPYYTPSGYLAMY